MTSEYVIAPQALQLFWDVLEEQIGAEPLDDIFIKGGFSAQEIRQRAAAAAQDAVEAGKVYGDVQAALRAYYGRGARGLLQRIGQTMWGRCLESASFAERLKLKAIRVLPQEARLKQTLEWAMQWLRGTNEAFSAHTLDRDFMVVSHACPLAHEYADGKPICFLTVGLLDEAIHWAGGSNYSVEEISCQAAGASSCEFRINFGG